MKTSTAPNAPTASVPDSTANGTRVGRGQRPQTPKIGAALAAESANDEHPRQLERAVHDLATASQLEARIEADVRFHRILAEATGNPVFVLLLGTLVVNGIAARETSDATNVPEPHS